MIIYYGIFLKLILLHEIPLQEWDWIAWYMDNFNVYIHGKEIIAYLAPKRRADCDRFRVNAGDDMMM